MRMSDLYQFVILMGVAILYCAPEGARGSFGEGTASKITQYILRNWCFGPLCHDQNHNRPDYNAY